MRRPLILFALLATSLSLCWAPGVALSQPAPPDADKSPKETLLEGQRLLEQGQFQEALNIFQQGYKTFQDPEFVLSSGYAYLKLERFQEAKDSFEEYLRLAPKSKNKSKILPLLDDLNAIINTRIKVTSTPAGATVWLDSQDNPQLGVTPFEASVSPGPHTLLVQKTGYALGQLAFEAQENSTVPLAVSLTKEGTSDTPSKPLTLEFSLQVNLANATVTINGDPVGTTPINKPFTFASDQPPTVEVTHKGYNPYRQKLPAKGGVYLLDVTLKKEGIALAPIAVFGLAAASSAAGAFFGVKALQNDAIFSQIPSPDLLTTIQEQAILSDVGFGLGLAGAVGGVLLLRKSGGLKGSPGELTPKVALRPSLDGVVMSLRF